MLRDSLETERMGVWMMMRRILPMLALSLLGCKAPPITRADRDMVYAGLLDSLAVRDSASLILLSHKMVQPWMADTSLSDAALSHVLIDSVGLPGVIVPSLVASLRRAPYELGPLPTRVPIAFDSFPPFSKAVRDSLLRHGEFRSGFERYRQAYPGARSLMRVSVIGFSGERRTAVVYVERTCGMLCGGGEWVILRRRSRRWRIVEELQAWVT
ncbi:MAG: hypothetical protein JWO05_1043 [Gemmatimonadetes bacterium]|nr:hypothetical protein [Gemmatimonadota bacterium]